MVVSPEPPSMRGDEESDEDKRETGGEKEAYEARLGSTRP